MHSNTATAFLSLIHGSNETLTGDSQVILNIARGSEWCLTIDCQLCDLKLLENIRYAKWAQHTSIKFGSCLGNPTWWSFEEQGIIILVGEDTQLWKVCITIIPEEVDNFLEDLSKAPQKFNI